MLRRSEWKKISLAKMRILTAPLLRHVSVGPLGSPIHRLWTFCALSQETNLALTSQKFSIVIMKLSL